MRILLSTDTVGGVWDYTVTLARELRAADHEVLLAVVGQPDPARLATLPPGVEVRWRELRLEWMPDAEADVEAGGEWLAGLSRAWGADVAHLNQMAYAAHPFGAPTLVVVHSDVLSWFHETLGSAPGPEWDRYTGWVRHGLVAASVVVAPSAYQSELTRRHFGRGADRVIHNGTAPPHSAPASTRHPLALVAGRAWDPAKGVALVDRAAAALRADGLEVHLFGDERGPHGQGFTPQHLVRHGRAARHELDLWMSRAAIYVGASLYEPFGLAPLEAALHGCALVLSDIGSFRELWDGCAIFFPRGDADGLADALRRLHSDPGRRAALAHAAYTRARQHFTAARCASDYLALYAEMAGAAAAPHPALRLTP